MWCGRDAPIIEMHGCISLPLTTNYIITTSTTRHPGPLVDSPDYKQAHSSPWATGCLLPLAHGSKAHSSMAMADCSAVHCCCMSELKRKGRRYFWEVRREARRTKSGSTMGEERGPYLLCRTGGAKTTASLALWTRVSNAKGHMSSTSGPTAREVNRQQLELWRRFPRSSGNLRWISI
jgi:hypothetical protein